MATVWPLCGHCDSGTKTVKNAHGPIYGFMKNYRKPTVLIYRHKHEVELDVVIYAAGGGRNGSSKTACVQAQLSSYLGI